MTEKGAAWLGIGGLFALVGLGLLVDRPPARVRNPRRRRPRKQKRVTRRRRRVTRSQLTAENPRRRRRTAEQLVALEVDRCERSARRAARPTTFARKREAVRALLDANPDLGDLVDRDCGNDCRRYVEWTGGGRRGPKPKARAGDGRFDALNERWERRTPGRKVASWKEALDATAPSSRHWAEFADRVPVLEEAIGFPLNLPERTQRVTLAQLEGQRCGDIQPVFLVLEEAPF